MRPSVLVVAVDGNLEVVPRAADHSPGLCHVARRLPPGRGRLLWHQHLLPAMHGDSEGAGQFRELLRGELRV